MTIADSSSRTGDGSKATPFLFAWVVSVIATCGSLFFSEIMHFEPCKLCWLQRICMYPLTVILGYAAFKEDRKYAQTAYPLSIVGFGVVLYHYGRWHKSAVFLSFPS
ncbi:disulfide bond formation protein B [Paenibacillus profundus]|uniref:Disulfide bond formation protein B n=2 Tax=Paenibacillus profundus TaxID=1173085 RepID=A0ABS8YLX0_9BACL|nr:disulfide bond formation protein B [Paenibacillus profundus]